MATLSPPFILCPLPDRQALLGIRPDHFPNKAIVTLGKNIAIRYHILEQKQECSWTTSRYWFTSPVTFCSDFGKYGAVLNGNIVALWHEDDSTLANMTKLKLPETVFGMYSHPSGRTVVVMKNGAAAYLSDVKENKNLAKTVVVNKEETITSFEIDPDNGLCYLITNNATSSEKCIVVTSFGGMENVISRRHTLGAEGDLLGLCILLSESRSCAVYLGSDGYIYKAELQPEKNDAECAKMANVKKSLSTKNPITMCPLSDNSSIAIYGCDASEEGAVVIIYDFQYDIVVSKQSLKLYSLPPLIEKVGQSLLVPLGLHILVLSFRITKSLLASVVGKHQAKLDEEVFEGRSPWVTKTWDAEVDILEDDCVTNSKSVVSQEDLDLLKTTYPYTWEIIQQIKIFESEGQPEAVICNHVIPAALEKSNGAALDWILDTFVDIPEVHLVSIAVFSLQEVSVADGSCSKSERLNAVLMRKFDRHLLTLSLRHVAYDDAKKFLLYLNDLIKSHWFLTSEDDIDNCPIACWLMWCTSLVDAHYTKFILHNDTFEIENLLASISDCTKVLNSVAEVEPFLMMTYSKVSFEPTADTTTRWRTETVIFE